MSDNLKTIKELADELGVSKTAINKKVTDRERKLWFSKIGNKFVINEDGQRSIKRMFEGVTENQESQIKNLEQKPNSQTENFRNNNENNADIKYIECINNKLNKWRIRWDIQPEYQQNEEGNQEERGVSFLEYEFKHKPSLDEIKDVVLKWYNDRIDT